MGRARCCEHGRAELWPPLEFTIGRVVMDDGIDAARSKRGFRLLKLAPERDEDAATLGAHLFDKIKLPRNALSNLAQINQQNIA